MDKRQTLLLQICEQCPGQLWSHLFEGGRRYFERVQEIGNVGDNFERISAEIQIFEIVESMKAVGKEFQFVVGEIQLDQARELDERIRQWDQLVVHWECDGDGLRDDGRVEW